MWKRGFPLLVLLAIIACATPGPQPGGVTVVLTSDLIFEPHSPEELADPSLQAIIKQCEEMGSPRCTESWQEVDNRSQFSRDKHENVYTVIHLSGLRRNHTYTIEYRLYDPNAELQARLTIALLMPPSWTLADTQSTYFVWSPIDTANWMLGRWRVELLVNGQLETERSFNVVENGSAKLELPRRLTQTFSIFVVEESSYSHPVRWLKSRS